MSSISMMWLSASKLTMCRFGATTDAMTGGAPRASMRDCGAGPGCGGMLMTGSWPRRVLREPRDGKAGVVSLLDELSAERASLGAVRRAVLRRCASARAVCQSCLTRADSQSSQPFVSPLLDAFAVCVGATLTEPLTAFVYARSQVDASGVRRAANGPFWPSTSASSTL